MKKHVGGGNKMSTEERNIYETEMEEFRYVIGIS